jgi:hypothetical protein
MQQKIKLSEFPRYQALVLTGEIRAAWLELGNARLPLSSIETLSGWYHINGDRKTAYTGNETVMLIGDTLPAVK